jgi:hypothetical protein
MRGSGLAHLHTCWHAREFSDTLPPMRLILYLFLWVPLCALAIGLTAGESGVLQLWIGLAVGAAVGAFIGCLHAGVFGSDTGWQTFCAANGAKSRRSGRV